MSNPICYLFGHRTIEATAGVEVCERCGDHVAYYLDGSQWTDRERYGLVEPIRKVWRAAWRFAFPRCQQCGKRIWRRRRFVPDEFCSTKCFSEWLPF